MKRDEDEEAGTFLVFRQRLRLRHTSAGRFLTFVSVISRFMIRRLTEVLSRLSWMGIALV